MESSQFTPLRDQEFQEGTQQAFTANTGVIDKLKEAQVERQFFLRDPPMRLQPRTQQQPEPLGSVDINLIETVAVLIAGVFAPAMTHGMVVKAPFRQSMVDVVLIGIPPCSGRDEWHDQADGSLPNVFQPLDHYHPSPLEHLEDRGLFIRQDLAPALSSVAATPSSLFLTASGALYDHPITHALLNQDKSMTYMML